MYGFTATVPSVMPTVCVQLGIISFQFKLENGTILIHNYFKTLGVIKIILHALLGPNIIFPQLNDAFCAATAELNRNHVVHSYLKVLLSRTRIPCSECTQFAVPARPCVS